MSNFLSLAASQYKLSIPSRLREFYENQEYKEYVSHRFLGMPFYSPDCSFSLMFESGEILDHAMEYLKPEHLSSKGRVVSTGTLLPISMLYPDGEELSLYELDKERLRYHAEPGAFIAVDLSSDQLRVVGVTDGKIASITPSFDSFLKNLVAPGEKTAFLCLAQDTFKASAHFKTGNYSEVITVLDRSLPEFYGTHLMSWHDNYINYGVLLRGWALFALGKYEEALVTFKIREGYGIDEHLETLLQLERYSDLDSVRLTSFGMSDYSYYHFYMGVAKLMQGDTVKALEEFDDLCSRFSEVTMKEWVVLRAMALHLEEMYESIPGAVKNAARVAMKKIDLVLVEHWQSSLGELSDDYRERVDSLVRAVVLQGEESNGILPESESEVPRCFPLPAHFIYQFSVERVLKNLDRIPLEDLKPLFC